MVWVVLRANREIRAGSKTFEYKSPVGAFLAKRFIYKYARVRIYVYVGVTEIKHVP